MLHTGFSFIQLHMPEATSEATSKAPFKAMFDFSYWLYSKILKPCVKPHMKLHFAAYSDHPYCRRSGSGLPLEVSHLGYFKFHRVSIFNL